MFQSVVRAVQRHARVVLANVTFIRGATSLAVLTVIGVIIAHYHVVQGVRVAHVNAGQEHAHRVRTDIGTLNVINSVAKVALKTYAV